ncbi:MULTISPECIES: BRO-N domain-containing protein [Brucella]|uniref:Bro-N domain-containing protein n=1 Tax=Brucella microti (strain BCCN 7-01 / CAPM 6434 / CCM 4915) TaxID=568815 RepID=C7LFW1_BRUMC|nr:MULTISPECIES: Bro-N domain-containing protein [Brucella]ACU47276.1 hypothetical protein BMI_I263 [Brucella microti CCM 4915]AIJ68560.1 hypothetical protein DM38_1614 [Brucella suis]EEY29293.1 predicted protein [Brucella suis bv. 5 str. 513]ENR44390.1 hypothetical protein C063_00198 [Brucella suis F8/06-2]ENT59455.1 hypothetical protein C007_00246 [Brucella suis F8/06-1]
MGQDGERTSWFVAVDLYDILFGLRTGISTRWFLKREETKTLRKAESAQYALSNLFEAKARLVSLISEAGLYKLILKSRKKEAQKFQNWLARDVIPKYLAEISANHI